MSKERRVHPRMGVELMVSLRDLGHPERTYYELTQDVSLGGMFIQTSCALEVGTPIELQIILFKPPEPKGLIERFFKRKAPTEIATFKASVVRTEDRPTRGMAVRLIDPDPETLSQLDARLRQD